MYGTPILSILTSNSKKSSSDQQIAELLSVDDLLDNPWHYDCVVSPRLLITSDLAPKSAINSLPKPSHNRPSSPPLSKPSPNRPLTPSLSRSSPNRPPTPLLLSRLPANHIGNSLSKPAINQSSPSPRLITQTSSTYVSLASFINNGDNSSYGSTAACLDFAGQWPRATTTTPPNYGGSPAGFARTLALAMHVYSSPSSIKHAPQGALPCPLSPSALQGRRLIKPQAWAGLEGLASQALSPLHPLGSTNKLKDKLIITLAMTRLSP
ncbi:hypothetical protein L7F22_038269 [Adiantum nelumboides]|nr:hypothetical protein [Adiantum nelumboides]